jgi:RimJ/RimL family protein N-acetyltransferase
MVEGKKVIIRQLEIGDEEYLHKWWNDSSMMEHAGLSFGTLQSKQAIKSSIEKEVQSSDIMPSTKRFLILKKESLEPIGEINYLDWDARNQKAEFGIKICDAEEQGKGYGQDALYHFIDFMFRFLNLNKIELTTMLDNKRAQNLYGKMGFKIIGTIREGYFDSRTGQYSDIVYMDILKKEWDIIKKEYVE